MMNTVEHIAQQLQARIRRGEWADARRLPGQRQLAESLGVSRASLREAITMLEGLGLLRSEAGRGVFIVRPGESGLGSAYGRWRFQGRYALRDVYLVRCELEELAAALAAGVVTRHGLARLRATVDQMEAAAAEGDLVVMAEGDHAFHAGLYEIAGSPLLQDIADSIGDVVEGSRQVAFADPARVREPIREHLAIIDALATGVPEQARRAMRAHIRNVADRAGLALAIPGLRPGARKDATKRS
ncbi:FadR/GntR family transcriptional regulator [Bordetella petrii]|uniref:FadR/GntR family transcriptional regulator n=1 Tax=Bordetella petrii TaxID=94624 RepID=UPI0038B3FCE3